MPDKWPLANGNWSNAANWNDGTKPAAGDDVYADGRTVTIDETIDLGAGTLRTTQRSGGTIGGGFTLGTGFNITAASVISGSTTCVTVNATTGTNTITANVPSGAQGGNNGVINKSNGGTLNVIGNVNGSDTNGSTMGITQTGGQLNITGNIIAGVALQSPGLRITGGNCVIVGNATGMSGSACPAIWYGGVSSSTLTITGTVTGGTGYQASGIEISSSSGTVTVNGNIVAPSSGSGYGMHISSTTANTTIIINGNVTAVGTPGFISVSSGGSLQTNLCPITVNGTITASVNAVGFSNAISTVPTIVNGNLICASNGNAALLAVRPLINPSGTLQHEYRVNNAGSAGVARSLYTGGVNLNQPATNNVRSGTVYGASNEFTGTCAVPGAASVAVGVPVDNTVGTATITAATIRAALGLASANLDTQLATKPTLTQIETSSVLAKQSTSTAIKERTDRIPDNPATSEQITSLQSNSPSEAF